MVTIIKARLSRCFNGFDSVDPRVSRVPLDLNSGVARKEYLKKHKEWFLTNHENVVEEFRGEVTRLYGDNEIGHEQLALLET